MTIIALPEVVALVGWSPNSQDLFYSRVLSIASATAPVDNVFSKKSRLGTLGALDFGKVPIRQYSIAPYKNRGPPDQPRAAQAPQQA